MKGFALTRKQIFTISIVIALLGLCVELLCSFFNDVIHKNIALQILARCGYSIDLQFGSLTRFWVLDRWVISPLNLLFYLLLILGAYMYYYHNRSRLLRMCLSVVFVSVVAYSVLIINDIIQTPSVQTSISLLRDVFLLIFAIKAIREIAEQNKARMGELPPGGLPEVSKSMRVLHLLLDSILILLIFVSILPTHNSFISEVIGHGSGDAYTFGIGLLLARMIYYLSCEAVLYSTPAKFLTGSVVVTWTDNQPSFGAVLKRTLCRLIPLESLTFLGENGLHDEITETCVASEIPIKVTR
jgi:hypothetical protein